MVHIHPDFKTKKAFKEAVANGVKVEVFNTMFPLAPSGRACVEAPANYHRWYAEVEYKDYIVTKVKA
jgi:hypothetical protein